jgi:hypothetical protein
MVAGASMVDLRNRVNRAWSLIDIELKRRHDLITRLIQCVAGYKEYETQTQTALVSLRNQTLANASVSAQSRTVIGLAEAYPKLKADTVFLKLMNELKTSENRLALARGYYNEAAAWQNTRFERFPEGFVAKLAGYRPRDLWLAADFEREPVQVKLSD